jgi:hypothetical protein
MLLSGAIAGVTVGFARPSAFEPTTITTERLVRHRLSPGSSVCPGRHRASPQKPLAD